MIKRIFPLIPLIILIACSPDISDPSVQAAVINSLTATVWTPTPVTPSATPEPNTAKIVDVLNNVIVGTDPLMDTIVAKYSVIDAQIMINASTQQAEILQLHVDCEWVYSNGCTPEITFVVLMNAFSANEKIMGKIQDQIPPTIQTLEMIAFDKMVQTSIIHIAWRDVWDFTEGKINGNQLGSRITRLAGMP